MEIKILNANMTYNKEDGYVGKVEFEVSGHKQPYEIALHSKHNRDWSYGLFFSQESGDEEQILAVEDWLEEDDDAFDLLVKAARDTLKV
ncbi:hypothetical protein [Gorillibacterium sp. sgz5001074]|uniref:hypothetical protein n=1 Tax=Gorillibacterium sp. sgz5001074 TaxID=3446695 RepID=UPI003F661652